MVPFFGGTPAQLWRHRQWLESLDFQVEIVPLELPKFIVPSDFSLKTWPVLEGAAFEKFRTWLELVKSKSELGLRHAWSRRILSKMRSSDKPTFVYSFSNPTASAIRAIQQEMANSSSSRVLGLIADGGPANHLVGPLWNYFRLEVPIPTLLRAPAVAASLAAWGGPHDKELNQSLRLFPQGFPVLSIRGWRDPLVSASNIEAVFDHHKQLHYETLSLPEGEHLNGLKDFPDLYKPRVERFLEQFLN